MHRHAEDVERTSVDVLFGQAYFLRFDPKLWEAQQPYAPLGALYAAACVRERGYRGGALRRDAGRRPKPNGPTALDRHRPRFAVLYEDNFNYLSKMCLLRMRAGRADDDRRGARAWHHASSSPDPTPRDHPEPTSIAARTSWSSAKARSRWSKLLDTLQRRTVGRCRWRRMPGLCLRDADGRRSHERPRATIIRDLDALPFPAWDLVDVDRYRAIWRARHGYFSMNMVTTRGCPYHCNWCAKPIYGQRYTARSPGARRRRDGVAEATPTGPTTSGSPTTSSA